ncbi:MAG TPA: glycosyltransferase, partial [Candidatus Polarisedimenticolaceae bacterium]|nr:glycosyltransferase [Candidatus Polarisedimenticolaceae bacterium]
AGSRVRVVQVGGAPGTAMERRLRAELGRNPRLCWRGELPHGRALRQLDRCRLLVIASRMEGGANALCEALAGGVPVLASRIDGNVGLLGADYPGYFRAGDTRALARLLGRAEAERGFLARLERGVRGRAALVRPERERRALAALLAESFAPRR